MTKELETALGRVAKLLGMPSDEIPLVLGSRKRDGRSEPLLPLFSKEGICVGPDDVLHVIPQLRKIKNNQKVCKTFLRIVDACGLTEDYWRNCSKPKSDLGSSLRAQAAYLLSRKLPGWWMMSLHRCWPFRICKLDLTFSSSTICLT